MGKNEPITALGTTQTVKVEYLYFIQEANAVVLSRLIESYTGLLPPWVEQLQFAYRGDNEGDLLQVDCDYRYRKVTIFVSDQFFVVDEDTQRQGLVHELWHAQLSLLCKWMRDIIPRMVDDDDKLRDTILNEFIDREEATVEQLAWQTVRQWME